MILFLDDFLCSNINFQPKKRKYHRQGKRLIVNHNGLDYTQFINQVPNTRVHGIQELDNIITYMIK